MTIEWKDMYSVGDVTIDSQHKKLLENVNKLVIALKSNKGKEVVSEVVSFLNEYINEHFVYEEEYMIKHKYPDFIIHKKVHDSFIEKFNEFKKELELENLSALSLKVQTFLGKWLIDHILKMDHKYYEFIRDNPKSHSRKEGDDFHDKMHILSDIKRI
jgi:hemerythrin